MPPHRPRPVTPERRSAVGVLCALVLVAGCSANPIAGPPPTIPPAQPAVSPPAAAHPAGTIRPLGGAPASALFDAVASRLAVFSPGADSQTPAVLTVFDTTSGPPRIIALPGPATALSGDGRGSGYLSTRGGYFVVDLATGDVARVEIDGAADVDFTAVARRADERMVLGSADGAVYTLAPVNGAHAAVTARAAIFARVDQIVTQDDTSVVLDRGQTSVTTIAPDGKPRHALRAGQGATTLAVDPRGPVLAADTRGGQLLVYGVDPLILRQAYPVPYGPYGLAGCAGLAWVSQTATNTVVGYDLATGIPVEKVRYPTVRQPNALACDNTAGTLYVVSSVGAGVQMIERAAVGR